jgi:hypothetical protein
MYSSPFAHKGLWTYFCPKLQQMETGFLHLHRTIAYIALLLLFISSLKSLHAFLNRRSYEKIDKTMALAALIAVHTQLILGFALYFIRPWAGMWGSMGEVMQDSTNRMWVIEHPFVMLVAAVLITIGYSRAKKMTNSTSKHRTQGFLYLLGFALVLSRVPWDRLF